MQLLSKYPIWLKTHGEFHIFTFFLLQCSLVKEKWHLACPFRLDFVSINLCAKNYQSIPKVSKVTGIFTVTFWPWHCLCQGKVAFGNSFVWFLSLFICLRNSIKNIPYGWSTAATPIFSHFLLWHCHGQRTSLLARSSWYLSVCQKISKCSQWFNPCPAEPWYTLLLQTV